MVVTTLAKSQKSISLKVYPSSSGDPLIMEAFEGTETLSKIYEFTLQVVSMNAELDFNTLIGKGITVTVDCLGEIRYFHGVVGSIIQGRTAQFPDDQATYYEIKMYPSLWMLKFVQDCRLFQNKTPMEIITSLLKEHNIVNINDKTRNCGHQRREYCVQYNETTYDFIHRLLEEEGVFYYFHHEMGKHTLIFGDDSSVYPSCPGYAVASLEKAQSEDDFLGSVKYCHLQQQVVSRSATLSDYNFTLASIDPLSKAAGQGEGGEIYTYPGEPDQEDRPEKARLEERVRLNLERDEAFHHLMEGASTIPFFLPGHRFKLKGHPRSDANSNYTLYQVSHRCQMKGKLGTPEGLYENTFKAFPLTVPFRPPVITPKPRIYSTQTARVTGPENEEIWTDKYGRIKVLFHWDRLSKPDQESSCWVRVAKGWASNNWGILFTPRIGMEVVVTFIEGNPDRPLVIGCVYNSDNMPPYLPEQPTKSTIKSRSSKGGEGFNEIRFEDLKFSEQIFMHAQKDRDFRVKETVTDWVEKGSFWVWIDQGNRETLLTGGQGVKKSSPENQILPGGQGDDNLTLLSGSKTTKLLGQGIHHSTIIPQGHHFLHIENGTKTIVGGNLTKLTHINQGKSETVIGSGEHNSYIGQGSSEDYIQTGTKTIGISEGKINQIVGSGSILLGVDQGQIMSAVEQGMWGASIQQGTMMNLIKQGDFKFRISQGNADHKITQGDHKTVLVNGNHSLEINSGNQTVKLDSGNRTVTLASGNDTLAVTGNVDHTITGNYTIKVEGNLTIVVGGNTSVESRGNINLSTPQSIEISAGQNINIAAGQSINYEAAASMNFEAGMGMNFNAGMEMSFNALSINQTAEMSYTLEAGLEASLSASLSTSITSAFISLA